MPLTITAVSTTVAQAEDALAAAPSDLEHLRWINLLVAEYVYTRPARARRLLEQQRQILAGGDYVEQAFYHYLHLGNLENQEYHDLAARAALERAMAGVDEYGDIAEKIEVYLDYAGTLLNLEENELASQLFDRSQRLLDSLPSPRLRARLLCREGYLHLHEHNYARAIPIFMEALDLLGGEDFDLNTKDHYVYTLVNSGLGLVWTRPDSEDKAAEAFRRAVARCEEKGLLARLPWHQLHLGKVLMGSDDLEEARANFRAIIDGGGNGSQAALAAAYLNLGLCYQGEEDSRTITRLMNAAERLFRELGHADSKDLISIDLARADIRIQRKDFAGGITILRDTLDRLEARNAPLNAEITGIAAEVCSQLAHCYAQVNTYELAYYAQCRADEYLDQHYELQDAKRQERFEAQFRAEARDKERESLELRASQLQLRALRAQMNPHFLYNALNSIQSFITTNEASTASKYLAKFAMLMRRSLEYTNREYITLEDEIQFLTDYLDINCHLRFGGKLTHEVRVLGDLEEDIIGVPTMILQPYVENAIEHGLRTRPKGHITVLFEPFPDDDENIMATVTDDGIGRRRVREMQADDPTRPYHQSRGTSITQSRLELLTNDPENRVRIDDLFCDDGRAAGTRVTVRIPVNDVLPRRSAR